MFRDELHTRINIADKEIAGLKKEIRLFIEQQRINIKITREGKGGSATLASVSTPSDWRTKIGIIAYLLRSSLDHLVWQLILQNGNTPTPLNQFPISDDVVSLPSNTDEMLNGLSEAHDRIIRGFGGMDITINHFPLLDLNVICNIDKHRHAHRTVPLILGLSDDYQRREFECSEQGKDLPEVGRDDLVVQVWFQDSREVPKVQRKLQGEVIGILEACSAAVKGVVAYFLVGTPVSWPFVLSGERPNQTE